MSDLSDQRDTLAGLIRLGVKALYEGDGDQHTMRSTLANLDQLLLRCQSSEGGEYEQGWNDGYKAAISVLKNIGAPQIIDRLEGTFIGSAGALMGAMLEEYEGHARELMQRGD